MGGEKGKEGRGGEAWAGGGWGGEEGGGREEREVLEGKEEGERCQRRF